MPKSIRFKIGAVLAILILLVFTLAGAGLYAVRLDRQQVRDVAWRVNVLPVAAKLSRQVAALQTTHGELRGLRLSRQPFSPYNGNEFRPVIEIRFSQTLLDLKQNYEEYRQLLENRIKEIGIEESFAKEFSTVNNIRNAIQELNESVSPQGWSAADFSLEAVEAQLQILQRHTDMLPIYLTDELNGYSQTMKRHSGILGMTVIICVTISIGLMLLLIRLSFIWIFKPLHVLVEGSRQVAAGKYGYRITLPANDEIGELAESMNRMTERFEEKVRQLEESRKDLDEKVRQKSSELVRNERLASVGFLAAGVAHEINNPLMAISACTESLQRRMETLLADSVTKNDDNVNFVRRYLTMIQEEAFRCKGITERLLSIARNEPKERTQTDLVPIIVDMLEMTRQQNAFKRKKVELELPKSLEITVNAQEMKQVVLNLLTNAFQNTEEEGRVRITLSQQENAAVLSVQDDGIGMEPDVLKNIFEPFFTRRKEGHGNGLGLSITHRIIEEHQGRIEALSKGHGKGSTFVIELPVTD